MKDFSQFKKIILNIAREDGSCVPGYKEALIAENFGQMMTVFKKHWPEVTGKMHFKRGIEFLEVYYDIYKEEFQKYGIFYNCDADHGLALINNCLHITLGGNVEAQIYGRSEVDACGNANLYATDNTWVHLSDNSSAILDGEARADANGRSKVNARENNVVHAYESSEVIAGGSTHVYGHGWRSITAYGESTVTAPINRKIYMRGTQSVTIKPIDE